MKINEAGIKLITLFEGSRNRPYPDPGTGGAPFTIGIGATFYQDGRKVTMADPALTDAQIIDLLKFHLAAFEKDVVSVVKVALTSNQFSALVSFAFNCGVGNLKSSTLLKKLNAKDYAGAADQFLVWTKAAGKELPGLIKRRAAERLLFLTPDTATTPSTVAPASKLPDGPSLDQMDKMLADAEKKLLQ